MLNQGEMTMRLVVTKCRRCEKITSAQHAESIEDLEKISAFIKEAKNCNNEPLVLEYRHTDAPLKWCNCDDSEDEQPFTWN